VEEEREGGVCIVWMGGHITSTGNYEEVANEFFHVLLNRITKFLFQGRAVYFFLYFINKMFQKRDKRIRKVGEDINLTCFFLKSFM
jgi:hypothetical protein